MPVKNYVSRNGQVEYEYDDLGDILTYGRDALGNVVAGYDAATNAVFTADYKPYGEFAATTGNVAGRRFMWVGSWGYRFTSGVPVSHYVRARHLSMRMGMWTSVDPLWPSEPAFGYVGGMPTAFIDPLGLQSNRPPRQVDPSSRNNSGPGGKSRPNGVPSSKSPAKPSNVFVGGKCSLTTCEYMGFIVVPSHVEYCFQTANPNKSCSSNLHPDSYTGGRRVGSCADWMNNLRSATRDVLRCYTREMDCTVASLACECISEWIDGTVRRPHYVRGLCYSDDEHILNCACQKLRRKNPSPPIISWSWWTGRPATDHGCLGNRYHSFGPMVFH